MKKGVLYGIIISLIPFVVGCRTLGVRMNYYRDLSKEEREKVIWTRYNDHDSLVDVRNNGLVYAITGAQLEKMLHNKQRALVYQWSPMCGSKACLSLNFLQSFCTKHSIELFVVADFYYNIFSQCHFLIDHPVFIANEVAYGTDKCKELQELFYSDLLGKDLYELHSDDLWFRYFYFENGKFVMLCQDPLNELK